MLGILFWESHMFLFSTIFPFHFLMIITSVPKCFLPNIYLSSSQCWESSLDFVHARPTLYHGGT